MSKRVVRAWLACLIAFALFLGSIPDTASAASESSSWVYKADDLVKLAKAQYGKKYVHATSGPNTFDCSGLVSYLFKQYGIKISNNTNNYSTDNLSKYGVKIDIPDLKPGDVVVFGSSGSKISHVGIYIGSGIMINAMNPSMGVKYCFIGKTQYSNNPAKNTAKGKTVKIDGNSYTLGYWSSSKLLYGVRIYGQQFSSVTYKNPVMEVKSLSPVQVIVSAEETVKYGSATLTKDKDYTASYQALSYDLSGEYPEVTVKVKLTGKGKYKGVVFVKEYTVDQATYNKMLAGSTANADGSLNDPPKPAPAEQTPSVPDESAPAETSPAAPAETTPAETTPAAPAETTPAETTPAAPAESVPAETTPAAPAESAPAEQNTPPVNETNETEDPSVHPAYSESEFNESTLSLRHAILPAGVLAEGRAFTISGQICSDYQIRSVSIAVYDAAGNQQFGIEKNICRHVFSLYSVDSKMAFSTLKAGDYTYKIKAVDFKSDKTWTGSFSVCPSDVIGSDCTYPKGTLEKGQTFSCKGTVSSGSQLSEVTMSVYSVTGVKQFAASAVPGGKSFDLHSLDSEMTFRKLEPGKYIYRVAVRDVNGITSYVITYSFDIRGDGERRIFAETGALSMLGMTYEELSYVISDLSYDHTIDEDVWYAFGHYNEFGGSAYCQFTFYDTAPGDPAGTVSVVWFNDTEDSAMQIAGDVYTTLLYSNLWDIEGLSELTYVGRWDIKDEFVEGLTASYRPLEDVKIDLCFRGEEISETAPIYAACISIDEAYEPGTAGTGSEEEAEKEPMPEGLPEPAAQAPYALQPGSTLTFGSFEQDDPANGADPLLWRVLALSGDGTKALLISEYALENIQFDEYSESRDWSGSTLRAWLNDAFFNAAFSDEEKKALLAISVWDTFTFMDAGADGTDRVFCLTQNDAVRLFTGNADRKAKNSLFAEAQMKKKMLASWFYPNTMAEVEAKVSGWNSTYGENCSWWWLRDPAGAAVNAAGEISAPVDRRDLNSVRPAVWVDLAKISQ